MEKITLSLHAIGNDSILVKKIDSIEERTDLCRSQVLGRQEELCSSPQKEEVIFTTRMKPRDKGRGGDKLAYWVVER